LRFDDHRVRVALLPNGIFEQTMPGQSLRKGYEFAIGRPSGSQRGEPHTGVQRERTLRRGGAEPSKVEEVALELNENVSVGACFEPGPGTQPGRNSPRPGRTRSLCYGSAHGDAQV
jgi:hypothetical protein